MARCVSGAKPLVTANGIPVFMKHHQMQRPRMPIGPQTAAKLIVTIRPCSGLNQSGPTIWSPRDESQPPQRVIIDKGDIFKGNLMLEPNSSYRFHQLEQIEEITELDSADSQTFKLKSCNSETHIHRLDGGCMNWRKKRKEAKDGNTKEAANNDNTTILKDGSDNVVQKLDQIECLEKEIARFSQDLKGIQTEISDRKKNKAMATDVNGVLLKLKQKCISLQGSIDKLINDDPSNCHYEINEEAGRSPDCGRQGLYNEVCTCEKELPQPSVDETYFGANVTTEQCCDTPSASQKHHKTCIRQEVSPIDMYNLPTPPLPPSSSGSDESDVGKTQQLPCNSPKSTVNSATNYSHKQPRVEQNCPIITYGLTPQSIPKIMHRTYPLQPRRSNQRSATSCTCHSGSEKTKKECQISKLPVMFHPSKHTLQQGHRKSHTNPFDQSVSHKRMRRQSNESDASRSSHVPPETTPCCTPSTSTSKKSLKSTIITHNLLETIYDLVGNNDPNYIALTVIVKPNNLYYINISVTNTGQSLGDICATEAAVKQAKCKKLFKKFLTFFILNSKFTPMQKNTILGHSFQLIDTESGRKSNFESRSHRTKHNNLRRESCNRQQDEHLKTEQISNVHGLTDQTPSQCNRLQGGNRKSFEIYDKEDNLKTPKKGPFVRTGRYYDMSNYPKHRIAESGSRIGHLEEQVLKLREELTNIREELVPQDDIIRFSNLSERLQELNVLLQDLRRSYEDIDNPGKKTEEDLGAENDKRHSVDRPSCLGELNNVMDNIKTSQDHKTFQPCEMSDIPGGNYAPPDTAECKKFLDSIKNPTNLFERHLLMIKDFRTDAELRRQRLQRKRQEKAELKEMKTFEGNCEKKRPNTLMATDEYDCKLFKGHASDMEPHACCSDSSMHFPSINYLASQVPNANRRTSSQCTQTEGILGYTINPSPMSPDATALHSAECLNNISPNCSVPSLSDEIINSNLGKALKDLLDKVNKDPSLIVLTITLESNNLYHINVWTTSSARSLSDLYASEEAIQEAEAQDIFGKFLTYIVVSDKNTSEQKHRLLRHSFKIIKEHQ